QGCGLPPETAQRLFEAFYTTKPDGMGIGLSICRSIIEFHRGRLWYEPNTQSLSGQGTVFAFTLPEEIHAHTPSPSGR
ncbi:MAG: ATP-binding protein, partial [Azovibrio sp.]|nr:ATP-binding protein [Azovibrio sp.]